VRSHVFSLIFSRFVALFVMPGTLGLRARSKASTLRRRRSVGTMNQCAYEVQPEVQP
jgi:hypothetical protein